MKIILILIALVLVAITIVMQFFDPDYHVMCIMLYAAITATSLAGTINNRKC